MKQHTRLSDFAHAELPLQLYTQETQVSAVPQFRMPLPQAAASHSTVETVQKQEEGKEERGEQSEQQKPALLPIQQKLRSTSYGGVAKIEPESVPQSEHTHTTDRQTSGWPIDPSTPGNQKLPNATIVADSSQARATLWDLRFFITPFKRQLALIAILVVVSGLLLFSIPLFASHVLDAAIQAKSATKLLQVCVLFFLILALAMGAQAVGLQKVGRLSDRVHLMLVEQSYKRILAMPLIWYQQMVKNGTLTAKLRTIAQGQEEVVQALFTGAFFCVLLFISMLVLIVTDWRLGLLAIGMAPIIFIAEGYDYQHMQKVQQVLHDEQERLYTFLYDSVQNVPMVKAMLAVQNSLQQMRRHIIFSGRARIHIVNAQIRGQSIFSLVLLVLEITLLGIGGYLAVIGKLAPGHLFACLLLLIQIKHLFSFFVRFQQRLPQMETATHELLQVLQLPQEDNAFVGINPLPFRGAIQLKHIHFANESGEEILHDISLDIPAESTVAIVGTGTEDKLALLYLLMSLYQPKSGTIVVDNHHMQEFSQETLRQHYGLLLAQAPLFNGTIEENITMGLKRTVSIEEIEEAAHYANILSFIRKQPLVFKSELWHPEQNLSAGERQRLAIARLLLLQPKVLLIEECVQGTDPLTQQALKRIKHGRTNVIIAHHLSTLQQADQVVLLDHGRVIAQGTHDELCAQYGEYWNGATRIKKAG